MWNGNVGAGLWSEKYFELRKSGLLKGWINEIRLGCFNNLFLMFINIWLHVAKSLDRVPGYKPNLCKSQIFSDVGC